MHYVRHQTDILGKFLYKTRKGIVSVRPRLPMLDRREYFCPPAPRPPSSRLGFVELLTTLQA